MASARSDVALHAHACEQPEDATLLVSNASENNANADLFVDRHEQFEQNKALSLLFVTCPDQSRPIRRSATLLTLSSFKAIAVNDLLSFSDGTDG